MAKVDLINYSPSQCRLGHSRRRDRAAPLAVPDTVPRCRLRSEAATVEVLSCLASLSFSWNRFALIGRATRERHLRISNSPSPQRAVKRRDAPLRQTFTDCVVQHPSRPRAPGLIGELDVDLPEIKAVTTPREFSSFDFRVHSCHSKPIERRLLVSDSRPQRPGGPKLSPISKSVSVRRRIPHEEAVVFDTRSCPWLSVDHDAGPGLRGCATGKSRWLCCAGRLSSRWANRQLDSEHGRCVSRCAR